MLDKVRAFIDSHLLLENGDHVLVAVSGGSDSIVLLDVLVRLKNDYLLKLEVVHVNHQFRGDESDADEAFVRALASNYGLPCHVLSVSVTDIIAEQSLNPQVASRLVRYDYFRQIGAKTGANKLAVAHHADDQAETVVMRWLRGGGVEGLAGMPIRRPEGKLELIRPIFQLTKSEIEAYCLIKGLAYRKDRSNESRKYFRNQIRLDVLPFLEQYNPGLRSAILRLSQEVSDDNEWMRKQVETAYKKVLVRSEPNEIEVNRAEFFGTDVALQRRMIKLIWSYLLREEAKWQSHWIEAAREVFLRQGPSKAFHLGGGLWIRRSYETVLFTTKPPKDLRENYEYVLTVPGVMKIPEWGYSLQCELLAELEPKSNVLWQAVFDAVQIPGPLTIRNRRPGDRLNIQGLNGTKKVKDMFIDAKVAREKRDSIPIVLFHDTVLCIPGFRSSDFGRPSEQTKTFLHLSMIE